LRRGSEPLKKSKGLKLWENQPAWGGQKDSVRRITQWRSEGRLWDEGLGKKYVKAGEVLAEMMSGCVALRWNKKENGYSHKGKNE